jgi:hypothetical protein
VFGGDGLGLVLGLTLFMLVLYGGESWLVRGPLIGFAVAAMIRRPLMRKWWFWMGIVAVLAVHDAAWWFAIDNHKYLILWWCIAVMLAVTVGRDKQQPTLAVSAALLIGLSMACAVGWKLASADYRDGSFFEFTLLTEPRFERLTTLLHDVPAEQVVSASLEATADAPATLRLDHRAVAAVRPWAKAMTWWTVGIEAAIATLFLLPVWRDPLRHARHAALLLFAATTYAIATVPGFAWVLLVMGTAQCPPRWRRTRVVFLLVLGLVVVYRTRVGVG